jgi:hypothetical protein
MCSATTACQDNCGATNNGCATDCDPNNPGKDNCGQANPSCAANTADGGCTAGSCNAFKACTDTCGNVDNSCPTACSTTTVGEDNCGQTNSACATGANDGGPVCFANECSKFAACEDECGTVDNSCYTECDANTPGMDNCGQTNPACAVYGQAVPKRSHDRGHETVLLPLNATASFPFWWHDAPGLSAPADLSVEMDGHVVMQVASVGSRPFAHSGIEVAPLVADVTYRVSLSRHDHVVSVKITRDGEDEVVFQSETKVADSATVADLNLAESFRRIAVSLTP